MRRLTGYRVGFALSGTAVEPALLAAYVRSDPFQEGASRTGVLAVLLVFHLAPWYVAAFVVRGLGSAVGLGLLFSWISAIAYTASAGEEDSLGAGMLALTVPQLKWLVLGGYALLAWLLSRGSNEPDSAGDPTDGPTSGDRS